MIASAVAHLRARLSAWPERAVILGSAQAAFADALEDRLEISYADIPGWPVPRVQGHAGKLLVGRIAQTPVTLLAGRVHLYEGWTPREVTFGLRVLGVLGLRTLVVTNAAGGINAAYHPGLLVALSDHINLQGANPLAGPNDDSFGPRFPDMTEAYSAAYRERARAVAARLGIELAEGVYAGLLGPNFETPAEIRFLRTIGADLAGMSTVPEVLVANHMGIRTLAVSTVTNMAAGMSGKLSHAEVLETGRASAGALNLLLTHLLPTLEA